MRHRERIQVYDEEADEEYDLFNWCTAQQAMRIRGTGDIEYFDPSVAAGDSAGMEMEACTTWLAEELWHEVNWDPEEHGVTVIDPEADHITVM